MKKNTTLILLLILIIMLLIILCNKIYEEYNPLEVKKSIYPFEEYTLNIDGFTYINSVISNNKVYSLYKESNNYLLKEIDTTSKKEIIYSNYIDLSCKISGDSKPYITCKDERKISVYNSKLEFIKEEELVTMNDYTVKADIYINKYNEYQEVIDSKCNLKCLQVRKDILTNKINLYKENILKEEGISKFGIYEKGIFTYKENKIRIYNVNNDYKEFTSKVNLNDKEVTLSKNEYILYVLNNKEIEVYNLYEKSLIVRIDLYKVKEEVLNIYVSESKLYVFTSNKLYVYDVYDIEDGSNNSLFENGYITNKVNDIKDEYGVNVYLKETSNIMHKDYDIVEVTNYNDIIDGLSYLEDYLLVFNKEFFKRFTEYDMKGLSIYFAYDITGGDMNSSDTDVVGLSFVKNNEYVIIIKLNSKENLLNVLFHETMHIIDIYLEIKGFEYEWNSLNPSYFSYENVYFPNVVYKDTLTNGKYSEEIYFVDNYSRVNEKEDRARIFEAICNFESYKEYPYLKLKIDYLKSVLIAYFPEVGYVKVFE